MKILILGHKGMLGHIVKKYLEPYYQIEILEHRWPSIPLCPNINIFITQIYLY